MSNGNAICQTLGTYITAALEQRYGVPEIKAPPDYGIAGTDAWMRELGQVLDAEQAVEKIIDKAHKEIIPQIEAYREKFKGKTAYIAAGSAHGHSLMAVMCELGFNVLGASLFHHDPKYDNNCPRSGKLAQNVKDYGDIENINICNKQSFEIINILNRLKPDVLIARHTGMAIGGVKLGIPSFLIDDEQLSFGYEGLLRYAKRIDDTLDNAEFIHHISAHCQNPYSKWWLEQKPNYFREGACANA